DDRADLVATAVEHVDHVAAADEGHVVLARAPPHQHRDTDAVHRMPRSCAESAAGFFGVESRDLDEGPLRDRASRPRAPHARSGPRSLVVAEPLAIVRAYTEPAPAHLHRTLLEEAGIPAYVSFDHPNSIVSLPAVGGVTL